MRPGNAKSKTPVFCLPLLSPFYIFAFITNENTDIMKLLRIIAAVVTALYFCACQQNDIQIKQLTNIDSVADNDAERALNMLDSIAPYMKNATEASRNYYELLKIKAQDKAYIPHTSDSTITRLVEYYESKGNKRLLLMSYYYAGRIYMDINNVPEALKYLQKVTGTGDHNNQLTYKAYSQIGYIFLYQELYDKGIEAFKKAYDYNRKTGNKNNQIHELCGIAECYNGKKQYTKALPYLKKALAISQDTDYKMMYYAILAQIANHYYNLKDYNTAKVYADKALNGVDSTNMRSVYSIAADIYNAKGLTDSAVILYQKLYGLNDVYAKQFASKKLIRYWLQKGMSEKALKYITTYEIYTDSIEKIIQTENVAKINALYNYQSKEKENYELKIKNQEEKKQKFAVMFALVLSTIMLSGVIVWYKYKNKLMQLEMDKAELAEKNRILEEQKMMNDKNLKIKSTEIYLTIKKKISEHQDKNENITEEEWDRLDHEVNSIFNEFYKRVHNLIPEISQHEYKVCLLLKIGTRPTDIARLTNHSKEAINSTRRRLYEKAFGRKGRPADWDNIISSL